MKILSTPGWEDYELLDSGDGKRLERFGKYQLVRPDPQIIWKPRLENNIWMAADAVFDQDKKKWLIKKNIPDKWLLRYNDLSFYAKLSPFKHTGIFPEQTIQWEWIKNKINNQNANVKNTDQ